MFWTELYHKIQVIGQIAGIIIMLIIFAWCGLLIFGGILCDWFDKRNKRGRNNE